MKYLYRFLFGSLIGAGLFIAQPVLAQNAEVIRDYQVVITVNQDSSILVQETIDYDFGTTEKHGIFRTLPYKYKNEQGNFNLRYSDFSISDGKRNLVPFTQSKDASDINLKIGDPDQTISGLNRYIISYRVERGINYFLDHDELYWNAVGGGWLVPIEKSSVKIKLPAMSTQTECFVGLIGSKQRCDITKANTLQPEFVYPGVLLPGQFFTVVVGLPAGTVSKPTSVDRFWDFVKDNGIFALPIFVFIIMFSLWWKYGRDAKGRGVVVAQYEPPAGMTPLYVGTLVDGKMDNRDLSAEIIYLAVQGFLKIELVETKKILWFKGEDYKFIKLKDADQSLPAETLKLFNGLFVSGNEVMLSSFNSNPAFSAVIVLMPVQIFKLLKSQGFYKLDPTAVASYVWTLGILATIGLVFLTSKFFGLAGALAGMASGFFIIVFGLLMPSLTKLGAETREHILGLKLYLSVAEKDRLEFHNAPEKKPEQFEKLLPYAMALGVEKQWAEKFEGIYNEQPSWYSDRTGQAFSVGMLSGSITNFSSSIQSAVGMATASGGGSGFSGGGSGGGGGGGGGGSW